MLIRQPGGRAGPRPETADNGSILVLVIGYTAIGAVLMVVGIDLSSVFLARRALSSAADSAALAAAQGIDRQQVYDGPGPRCGQSLPLSRGRAVDLAVAAFAADQPGLHHAFRSVVGPDVAVAGGTVAVTVSGEVRLPFAKVVAWLDPGSHGGAVEVSATSHASSPVAGDAGC